MRMRRDGKKYIEKALNTIGKIPDPHKSDNEVKKNKRKPVSVEGTDRDPRHQVITNYLSEDEGNKLVDALNETDDQEIDNDSFKKQKKLYEEAS